jgi:hypothetical protein
MISFSSLVHPDDPEGIIFKKTGRICLPKERTTHDLGRRLTASGKYHPERDPWTLKISQKIKGRNRNV